MSRPPPMVIAAAPAVVARPAGKISPAAYGANDASDTRAIMPPMVFAVLPPLDPAPPPSGRDQNSTVSESLMRRRFHSRCCNGAPLTTQIVGSRNDQQARPPGCGGGSLVAHPVRRI